MIVIRGSFHFHFHFLFKPFETLCFVFSCRRRLWEYVRGDDEALRFFSPVLLLIIFDISMLLSVRSHVGAQGGKTALDLAKQCDHPYVVQLIEVRSQHTRSYVMRDAICYRCTHSYRRVMLFGAIRYLIVLVFLEPVACFWCGGVTNQSLGAQVWTQWHGGV